MTASNNQNVNATHAPDFALRVIDLSAGYGESDVLRGLNLQLKPGEISGLIGVNGAGKSTLLRALVGELVPRSGTIEIERARAKNPKAAAPPWFRIAQQPDLPPYLSIHELVILGVKAWQPSRQDVSGFALELLEKWGLGPKSRRPLRLASPGEIRRGLFALVDGIRPDVLFLDEALSALDPAVLKDAESLLKDLASEGTCTLLISHDMGLAERVPDKVMLLHEGVIAEQWSRDDLTQARQAGQTLIDLFISNT